MISPYDGRGGGASFAPPPGLAQMLAMRNQQMQSDADNIGSGLGAIGAGVVGAVEGGQDPGVFGTDTTSGSGAFQGFLQNLRNAQNPGNGGRGGSSTISDMVSGGPSPGGMNVKQLQAAGKTADAFRDQMANHTSTVGDDDPKVLGVTDDEWDTLGAQQKWAKVQGFVQGNAQQAVMQKIADEQAQANERQANAKAMGDTGHFLKAFMSAPGDARGSNDQNGGESGDQTDTGTAPSRMERFAYAASQMGPDWDVARSMGPILNSISKFADIGGMTTGSKQFDVDNDSVPGVSLVTDRDSKKWQAIPRPGQSSIKTLTDDEGNETQFLDRGDGKLQQLKGVATDKDRLTSIDKELNALPKLARLLTPAQAARQTELQTQKAAILNKGKGRSAAPTATATDNDPAGLFGTGK